MFMYIASGVKSVQLVQTDSHEHHKAEATTGLYSILLRKEKHVS